MKPHRLSRKVRWLRLKHNWPQHAMHGVTSSYVSLIEKSPPHAVQKYDRYLRENFNCCLDIVPQNKDSSDA